MTAILYYVHDPMCSWCWAFRPAHDHIMGHLPTGIDVRRLLGGLAPDSNDPMPAEMQGYIQGHWRTIQARVPGTRFNFEFWEKCRPRRSTYPACRAVIAARNQGNEYEEAMTRAIQEGYYLQARNPSDTDTLTDIAGETGLDTQRFALDLGATETNEALRWEILLSRQLGVSGFPSMLLESNGNRIPLPVDYSDPHVTLQAINQYPG